MVLTNFNDFWARNNLQQSTQGKNVKEFILQLKEDLKPDKVKHFLKDPNTVIHFRLELELEEVT
jgi:hypothetical protein